MRGVEEFETAVFNEWDIPLRQLDFERSAMMRRAEQDRLLLQRRPALPIFQDTLHDVARLIGFVAHADEPRSYAGISVGPKVLGEALSCQTDHAICRREDCLGRAIVALQRYDLCRAKLCGEVEDVADIRGTERVNRLGVIADDGQPASAGLERQNDRSLEPVCVLVLIDEDMVEAVADLVGEARIAERLSPVEQEVVIIEHVLTLLGIDIGREQLLQLGRPGGAPRESHAYDFFDRKFGIDATGIDREACPLCRKAAFRL